MVGIHAKPDDAELEIDYLTDVYDDVVSTWGTQVCMIVLNNPAPVFVSQC